MPLVIGIDVLGIITAVTGCGLLGVTCMSAGLALFTFLGMNSTGTALRPTAALAAGTVVSLSTR